MSNANALLKLVQDDPFLRDVSDEARAILSPLLSDPGASGGHQEQDMPAIRKPLLRPLPPMNLHAQLYKWTTCKNCGSDFEQRKSGKKRTCPSCRGVKPR